MAYINNHAGGVVQAQVRGEGNNGKLESWVRRQGQLHAARLCPFGDLALGSGGDILLGGDDGEGEGEGEEEEGQLPGDA